ncbi:MAG: 30S ribosomal protein S16 [Candidatus Gracilibacteria bacterium]|nr:30S ribosomal protein S16 [Candidatus Gracilibacteria bacterium]
MLVIRFSRIGRSKQAIFKLVVAEKARAVQKKFIEEVGYYNPRTDKGKGEFTFDAETIKKYLKNGAKLSQSAARMLAKEGMKEAEAAIIARPTKPKKEKAPEPKEEAPAAEVKEEKTEEAEAPAPAETASSEEKADESAEEKKEETPEEPKEEATPEAPEEEKKAEDEKDKDKK